MNSGRNNYSRKKYSDRHYKKLVIEDKKELDEVRSTKSQRMEAARENLVKESGYEAGYKQYVKSKHSKKRRNFLFGFGKKAIAAAVLVVVLLTGSLVLFPASAKAEIVDGYEVILNGTVLGVAEKVEPISNALDDIILEFKEDYDMDVFDTAVLEYNPVKIDKQFICPDTVFVDILKGCIDVKVMAWVILVNNAPAAAVKTEEEANSALDRVKAPFLDVPTERNRISVGFVEDVTVKQMAIEYSQVTDEETAYNLLRFGKAEVEQKNHVVVSGESLYKISKSYGVTVADLRKANPALASNSKIYPGDKLLIASPLNRVNVKFVEEVDKVGQVIEYETEEIKDDSMYKTQVVEIQPGVNGSHDVHALITFINGVETEVEVISEENRIEPVNRIIKRGTKTVPKLLEKATSGGMIVPIRDTYRVSSKFGPRSVEVAGASTWHKGVDLAADKGTPIYACEDGVVTHSGSGTGYGLYIKIDHGNGVETRYGHCSELLVSKGERVEQGQLIALVGNTGVSSGPHLHWEVRVSGKAYDPLGEYDGPAP
ncbi:MAG: M23 family metallopeptidase [Eubacteriales bacterium]